MRLNEYIQKSLFPDIVPDFDPSERKIMGDWTFSMSDTNFVLKADILNKINKECSQIIQEYKKTGKVLFRGSKSKGREVSPHIYKCVPRENRRPKDTSLEHHMAMDALFKEKFGWYVRSEGVFTSNSPGTASSFGDLNLFLPVNGYKCVWSEHYSDLYSDFLENLESYLDDMVTKDGYWLHPITGEKFRNVSSFRRIEGYVAYEFEDYDSRDVSLLYKDKETGKNTQITMEYITKIDKDSLRFDEMQQTVDKYESNNLSHALRLSGREIIFKCRYFYLIGLPGENTFKYSKVKIEDFGLGL